MVYSSSNKLRNCLGKLFLDKGQSLEPVPPARIIGIIFKIRKYLKLKMENLGLEKINLVPQAVI